MFLNQYQTIYEVHAPKDYLFSLECSMDSPATSWVSHGSMVCPFRINSRSIYRKRSIPFL